MVTYLLAFSLATFILCEATILNNTRALKQYEKRVRQQLDSLVQRKKNNPVGKQREARPVEGGATSKKFVDGRRVKSKYQHRRQVEY